MKNIAFRYISLVLLSLILINSFFTEVLIFIFNHIVFLMLFLFLEIKIESSKLILSDTTFQIVRACIAPSMYVLFTIIFFSSPIKNKILLKNWSLGILLFTIFNLIRILILILIHINLGSIYFDKFHFLFYEILSAMGIGIIILFLIKPIREEKIIPIYTDIKTILRSFNSK